MPAAPGLRPTPDRVRETLFNWLQPVIAGSRCLDLFAGSGALGLEAHSRGAADVVLVERSEPVARQLRATVRDWGLSGVSVERADALRWLAGAADAFDIVFLDPPFGSGLLEPVCARLTGLGWLSARALVYLEVPARGGLPALPDAWMPARQGQAGDVGFALVATGRSVGGAVSPVT